MNCPLCRFAARPHFDRMDVRLGRRAYWLCPACGMIFLDPALRWPPAQEKARYDLHRNHPEDEGYLTFLRQLATPLGRKLASGSRGLDYGCGPSATLALLLQAHNVHVAHYDPFYFPDTGVLGETYDFLACSEVVEHFHRPRQEFARLDGLLRVGGHLGIMTQVLSAPDSFVTWWYHLDPTHVCFYQRATLDWIARWRRWQLEYASLNVAIFTKLKPSRAPCSAAHAT